MPIKPLTVLPQLKPVTYQDPTQNNQSFRILEEIIQQENANERARQSGLLASEKAYGDLLASNAPLADNPYQQRELGAVEEEKMNFTKRLQNTYDPVERMSLVNQARSSLFNKPGYSSALLEKASAERFNEIAKSNADDVDPDFYNKVMSEYYREDRTTPMRPQDFNPGRLLKSPDKAADDFIKNLKYDDETIDYDRETNQVVVRKNTVLADENTFKDALAERMANSVVYQGWDIEKTDAFINRKWEEEKRKALGTVIKTMHSFEDDAEKAEKLAKKEKETSAYKAFTPGEEGAKLGGLQEVRTEEDGTINVFNKEGGRVASGTIEQVWNSLTDQVQNDAKRFGITPNFDLPNIGRNKADIVRNGSTVGAGLNTTDAKIAGVSKTTFTPDGWMHTNDPEALSNAGYTSGYDTSKKQYYITKKDGDGTDKVYEGSPTFRTTGGGKIERRFVVKVDDGFKDGKKASSPVGKNTHVPIESDDLPELRMIAPEESGTEGDLAINASDMGAPSIGKTQINDANVQKEWLGSVGLGDEWGNVLKEDTTARQSLEKEYRPKLDAIKEVGGEKEEELKAEE